jgi:hypothetical protein
MQNFPLLAEVRAANNQETRSLRHAAKPPPPSRPQVEIENQEIDTLALCRRAVTLIALKPETCFGI